MDNIIIDLEHNIKLHYFKDEKYKTNCVTVLLTVPLKKETVTQNALIPIVLRRGTKRLKNMQEIEKEMENMYGANINSGIDKSGKNQILKFYIESINDSYANDNIFEQSIKNLSEIILSPYLEEGTFSKEYVEQEKNTLKLIIQDKINDKASYATYRCIEEMFNKDNYGLYVYGDVSHLDRINNQSLYNQYINILKSSKIDIFVSTDNSQEEVIKIVNKYFNNKYFEERNQTYIPQSAYPTINNNEKIVKESMKVIQGKLMIGLNILNKDLDLFNIIICNAVLGVGCNSKMFRIVREKYHLAYSANSSYILNSNTIVIKAGIEISNYEKTLNIINEQLTDMKNGNISDRELNDAKQVIISSYKTLYDEQYKLINYYINQEMLKLNVNLDEAIRKINNITKKDVINVANELKINTIYFLKNIEE